MSSPPFTVRALYPYESEHPDDLTFQAGQQITVEAIEDDEWYSGTYIDGSKSGMFPKNFVEFVPDIPVRPKRSSYAPTTMQETPVETPVEQQQIHLKEEFSSIDEPSEEPEEPEDTFVEQASQGIDQVDLADTKPGIVAPTPQPSIPKPNIPVASEIPLKPAAPVVSESPEQLKPKSAFKDRIAAFNVQQDVPLMPQKQQFKNESFIKKPYVAPPPSSHYVPTFSDDRKDSKQQPLKSPPIVPSTASAPFDESHDEEDEGEKEREREREQQRQEEESQPKMSLKERIAMLHKQQQEEQERIEAAQQKKKAKKKERELERVKSHDSAVSPQSPTGSVPPVPHTGPSIDEEMTESTREVTVAGDEEDQPVISPTSAQAFALPIPQEARSFEPEAVDEAREEHEEDEDEEEESSEEEDEEEAKRIALRERMAKISGGAGMNLGMLMGGGFPSPSTKKSKKPKKPKAEETSAGAENEEESIQHQAPVPIFPFAAPGNLPPELQRKAPSQPAQTETDPATVLQPQHSPTNEIPDTDDEFKVERDEKDIELEQEAAPMSPVTGVPDVPPVPPPPPHAPVPAPAVDRRQSTESQRRQSGEVDRRSSIDSQKHHRQPSEEISANTLHRMPPPPPPPAAAEPIDEVIEDELGDDERTEPEEPKDWTSAKLAKRNSYMSGSGTVPPVPGSIPRKSATFDMGMSAEHHTMAPPPPSAPPAPPVPSVPPPAPIAATAPLSEEETTGYEADEDTQEISGTEDPQESKRSSIVMPPPLPPLPHSSAVPSSPISQRTSRPPPPAPPSGMPVPPAAPLGHHDSEDSLGADDEQDTDGGFVDYQRAPPPPPPVPAAEPPLPGRHTMSHTTHPAPPAPPPSASAHASPQSPPLPARRSSTRDSIDSSGFRRRQSVEIHHVQSHTSYAQDLDLQLESSDWWLQPQGVPPVLSKHSKEWLYEVEESQSSKRGGRTMVTKDIYVLYPDYSQTSVSLQYELHNPHETLQVEQTQSPPPSEPRKEDLEAYSSRFGSQVLNAIQKGSTSSASLTPAETVSYVISQISGALPAVGGRAFGAVVYQNMANASFKQTDEIRPGDIVVIRNAKFQGHKGGLHQKYSSEVGVGASGPYTGVIQEWDGAKKKLRVIEQHGKKAKQESFRLQDLKTGEIIVYRVVGRGYVGWE